MEGVPPPPPPPPPPSASNIPTPPPFKPISFSEKNKANSQANSIAEVAEVLKQTNKAQLKGAHYYDSKSSTGFIGLGNQGATCYINSLIQSLLLVPEFVKVLFSWRHKEEIETVSEDEKSRWIPLQLQFLFARLLLSERKSLSTKELTHSFGWGAQDVYVQHDLQELRVVLFDALIRSFNHSTQTQSIESLFEGTLENYIQCFECNNRSTRCESYNDISVNVEGISKLEDSLYINLSPEELVGDNKYFCQYCNCKCDAIKGISYPSFPPVLTFQLRRFTFDFNTFQRIKINSFFSFPMSISMAPYASNTPSDPDNLDYELISVLIHSGTAQGGHYFCYAKSVDQNKWLCFNDESVKEISEEEINDSFGFDQKDRKGVSKGLAYMVVYRRKNLPVTPYSELVKLLPSYVTDTIQEENRIFLEEKFEFQKQKDTLHLQFIYKSDKPHLISIYKYDSIQKATEIVYEKLKDQLGDIDLDCIRIRGYDKGLNKPTNSFEGKEDLSLFELKFSSGQLYFIETREKDQPFEEVDNTIRLSVKLHKYIDALETFGDTQALEIPFGITVTDFKKVISDQSEASAVNIRLFQFYAETAEAREYHNDEIIVDAVAFYYEISENNSKSKILTYFEKQKFTIEIRYNKIDQRLTTENISIDRRETLFLLKKKLSEKLGVAANEFKICENGLSKKEYKDLQQTIDGCKIFDGCAIYLCSGKPLEKGEFYSKIYFFEQNSGEFIYLSHQIIHENWELKDLQEKLQEMEKDSEFIPKEIKKEDWSGYHTQQSQSFEKLKSTGELIYWRIKSGRRAGKVILENVSLKELLGSALQDGIEIALQITTNRKLQAGEMIIQGRKWNSSSWTVGDQSLDLIIPSDASIREVKFAISEQVAIPAENIEMIKCPVRLNDMLKDPISIVLLNWGLPEHLTISQSPWYLKDGESVLFRDRTEPEKEEIDPALKLAADGGEEAAIYIYTDFE